MWTTTGGPAVRALAGGPAMVVLAGKQSVEGTAVMDGPCGYASMDGPSSFAFVDGRATEAAAGVEAKEAAADIGASEIKVNEMAQEGAADVEGDVSAADGVKWRSAGEELGGRTRPSRDWRAQHVPPRPLLLELLPHPRWLVGIISPQQRGCRSMRCPSPHQRRCMSEDSACPPSSKSCPPPTHTHLQNFPLFAPALGRTSGFPPSFR